MRGNLSVVSHWVGVISTVIAVLIVTAIFTAPNLHFIADWRGTALTEQECEQAPDRNASRLHDIDSRKQLAAVPAAQLGIRYPSAQPLSVAKIAAMYPRVVVAASHIDVDHGCTSDVDDQAKHRPLRTHAAAREPFRIGYARTLQEQADLAAAVTQLHALQVDSERIFTDRGDDALIGHRPQLEAALSTARRGDTLVVADLARLARSHPELQTLHTRLTAAGIRLEVDGTDFDQLDPGRLLELTAAMHTRHVTEALDEDYRHRTQRHPQGPRRKLSPHERSPVPHPSRPRRLSCEDLRTAEVPCEMSDTQEQLRRFASLEA